MSPLLQKGKMDMAKLSITSCQGKTAVKCKLSREETVIGKEIDFLASCPTQFFMRPQMSGNKTIVFSGADGISMTSALRTKMNKDRYFLIVAQLVEMLRSAQQYGFDLNRLVLDPKFMLMNRQSGQIFIPYMTVTNCETPNGGIVRCLREVSTLAKFVSDYDFSFADNFMYFVMGMGRFSLADAEDYIRVNSPRTYNDIVRLPSIPSLGTIQHNSSAPYADTSGGFSLLRFIFGKAAIPVPVEDERETIAVPAMQKKPEPVQSPFAPPPAPKKEEIPENEPPKEELPPAEEEAPVQEKEPAADSFDRPEKEFEAGEKHEESESTMELNAALILRPAKLFRRSTGETFNINKPLFIIGKESARVDLCVTGNKTVSRVHAHIVNKNGVFYIIDQNSTNRTFVNGINVPANVEYRLRSGDEIRLSNELFDFSEN